MEESYIPVWPWHGDVSQSIKKRALKEAQGILQITPESMEALLMRHPGDAKRLFSDVRFVVVDEIHALMGTDRGLQVLCLLSRLERITDCHPRRIGLSATLNDYEPAKRFLASGSSRMVQAVGIKQHKRTISLCMESFLLPKDPLQTESTIKKYNEFIYENSRRKKCLIFTNSRGNAEKIITDLKDIAQERQEQDVFFVHHGSVSAALRKDVETALREREGAAVTAATLTLELGIDIGDLDSTIQIGAPYSCASFVQRLGRSGRRTGKSQMLFVNVFGESNGSVFDKIPWELLRAIAIIQLYLEERWVEPFDRKRKPFSLLVHQTISTLMTYGELSPSELARKVLLLPAFHNLISPDEYREILQYMLQNDYLQKMEDGEIIVGMRGERIANHYSFYAVFQDEQAFHVCSQEGEIGTLDNCPAVGEAFVLAGRTWKVMEVDDGRKIIYVNPIKNKRIPVWNGYGGHIHTKVVRKIREILMTDVNYQYLRPNALKLLEEARKLAQNSGVLEKNVIPYSENSFYLCPWVGSIEMQTIKRLLSVGLKDTLQIYSVSGGIHYLQVTSGIAASEIRKKLHEISLDFDDPDLVLLQDQAPKIDKYDGMVPDYLLRKAFLYNELSVERAVDILKNL